MPRSEVFLSLADELLSLLHCPACSGRDWDLRADGLDDLARLEGTLCCVTCGLAFAASGGVLDLVPEIIDGRRADLERRILSPPLLRLYEETFRNIPTPIASEIRGADRMGWIESHVPSREVERVVDFGCGRGRDLVLMQEQVSPSVAVGIDVSRALLSEAATRARLAGQKNVAFLRAKLEKLPLEPAVFDWANCYGVLHRLSQSDRSLAELASLLRPEGVFTCLTTQRLPSGPMELGQRFLGDVARVEFFEDWRLAEMFDSAGLEVIDTKPFGAVVLVAARRRKGGR